MRRAPAGATEWSSRDFRSPGRGSDSILTMNRWFAPPANVQCPFGTSRSLSSTNSRYAMRSRRFEVEDFAKQIPETSGLSLQSSNQRKSDVSEKRPYLIIDMLLIALFLATCFLAYSNG